MSLRLAAAAAAVAAVASTAADTGATTSAGEPPLTVVTARGGGVVVHRGDASRLPITHRLAKASFPALSPDGEHLAYVRAYGHSRHVEVRTLATGVGRVVGTVPVSGASLAFDHEGERLVIASENGVSIVPATGGAAVKVPLPRAWRGSSFAAVSVAADGRTIAASRTSGDGRRGTLRNEAVVFRTDGTGARVLYRTKNAYAFQARPVFSPDGRRVAVSTPDPLIFTVATAGGPRTTLFGATGRATLGDPLFSPDGTRVAFARTPQRGVADIWVVPAAGGIPRRVTTTPIPPRGTAKAGSAPLAWSPDGTKLLALRHDRFAVVDVATRSSTSIGRSRSDVVAGLGRWVGEPASAPHQLIAFERQGANGSGDIWVVRPDGTGFERFTDGGASHDPVWSPDGRQIAFVSDRQRTAGACELYSMRGDGTAERRLTASLGQPFWYAAVADPAWTRDGKRIAFARHEVIEDVAKPADLWSVGPDGENQLRLTETPQAEASPSFAADGDLVWEEGGRIWLRDSGSRRPVTEGTEPQLSPDGTRVAFVRSGTIAVARRDGSGVQVLVRGRSPAWSPDGRELVFAGPDGLFITPANIGAARRLTRGADVDPSWRRALTR